MPTLTSVTISDADYDGRVDTATAVFSAAMRDANVTAANATLGGAATTLGGTANDATLTFTYAADALAIDTSATAADFLYSGATTKLTDLYGNLLDAAADGVIATGIVEVDGASPVIVTTSPASAATGVALTANIVVTFSEAMDYSGCTFSSSPDPSGFGSITSASNWSGSDKIVTLTHTNGYNKNRIVTITVGGCVASVGGAALHANAAVPNPWSFTTIASVGVGSGGSVVDPAIVAVTIPNGGESFNAGQMVGISWTAANGAYTKFKVSYSSDNGNAYSMLTDTVPGTSTSYTWTVPSTSTTQGLIKVEGIDAAGTVLASDVSNAVFTIVGTTVAPPPVSAPGETLVAPATDSTVSGLYSKDTATANNPTINADKSLATVANSSCTAGDLIKGSLPAVYYCGSDGKRYVFVNDKAYFTWYSDFSKVKTVSDSTLASIMIGGNVTYRPGVRMVKIQSDPKVYAVSRGGTLRWISSEATAVSLYGTDWAKLVDDVADSFFVNYTVGADL
jgi:hypothetical protein